MLNSNSSSNSNSEEGEEEDTRGSCTNANALSHLECALNLIRTSLRPHEGKKSDVAQEGEFAASSWDVLHEDASTSKDEQGSVSRLTLESLEENVLIRMAYVHLCLSDPMSAVSKGKEVLSREGIVSRNQNR